jgi:hypothetical protein
MSILFRSVTTAAICFCLLGAFFADRVSALTREKIAGTGLPTFNDDHGFDKTNINPQEIAVHSDTGEVYFTDGAPVSRIRKITAGPSGPIVRTVAGTGQINYNHDGHATEVNINPHKIAFNPFTKELYFLDGKDTSVGKNTLIRKLDLDQQKVVTLVGSVGSSGWPDWCGSWPSDWFGCHPQIGVLQSPLEIDITPVDFAIHPRTGDMYFINGRKADALFWSYDINKIFRWIVGFVDNPNPSAEKVWAKLLPKKLAFHPTSHEAYFIHDYKTICRLQIDCDAWTDDRVKTVVDNHGRKLAGVDPANESYTNPQEFWFDPNGKLYVLNSKDRLLRLSDDHSSIQMVLKGSPNLSFRQVVFAGEQFYLSSITNENSGQITQHRSNGTVVARLATGASRHMAANNGNIYYADSDNCIYKLNTSDLQPSDGASQKRKPDTLDKNPDEPASKKPRIE